jgi:uncharacterized protein (DUF1778 family)
MSKLRVTSPERKDRLLGCKVSGTDGRVVEHAAKLERTTVSAFIREAVLPAARDTIVAHAIKAPARDDAA